MKQFLSLALTLVLVLGLLPGIALPVNASVEDGIANLQYDDHVDITGKTVQIIDAGSSAQGAVLTLQGEELIATGIGTAKVRIDGTTHTVTVGKAKLNLIMIMGQSNSGNHFANATSDVTCPAGTAYWWGNGQGTAATEPVAYTQPSKGFHTPLLAELYAQSVAAGDPVKNVMIWHEGITSKDGQSITKWASSATNTSGTDGAVTMLEKCRAYYQARSDRYEIVSSGIYWLQGETDTSMDPTTYTQCFMAMWQRLKNAGMEYLAFLRVRRNVGDVPENRDDLHHSSSLSAQIKMVNDNPEFYMATTLTENWIGTATDTHTIDISNYITMMQTYGQSASYTDEYGNDATYADGKLTTTMKSIYGSNNQCHYGKFGYGAIGADAAYHMYRALHGKEAAIVVTDTSGHGSSQRVLSNGQKLTVDLTGMTDNLSFRPACGSTAGTLKYRILVGKNDVTQRTGFVVHTGDRYGSVNVAELRKYENVSIELTYTTVDGIAHTALCEIVGQVEEPACGYIWDFDADLYARDPNGNIVNSFQSEALSGSYTLKNGYLTGNGLQLQLENVIELRSRKNWTVEWKYGALDGGIAGFLLCEDIGNTVGNKAFWHTPQGNFVLADYKDSKGYYNYTSSVAMINDDDCLRVTNQYDASTGKNTLSLWINDELVIADFQQKGCINGYHDRVDMSVYPLDGDFDFRYLGNKGMRDWYVDCPIDYLKISFDSQPEEQTYYLAGFIDGADYGCGEDSENMGQYQFVDGVLTTTFASDSYVFVKSGNNGKHLMSTAYCEDRSCTFVEGGSEKMKVPGYVEVTFTLTENADGSVTLDYVTAADNCTHSYRSELTSAPTCETTGTRTQICSKCGYRYTESIAATGHTYNAQVTAPTCTEQGYTIYVCASCGDRYTGEQTAATGHRYSGPTCTACGAANPDYVVNYYLVGYINGADYGCEADYENMGQYKFINGKLVATFTQDSYVFVKTEGNAGWFMTKAYCTDTTANFYNTNTGATEKMFVPGNAEITFTLIENADGSLTLRYEVTAPQMTKPTLTLKSPTLEFKDMITVNAFYTAENIQDVVEMGMITYSTKVSTVDIATAEHVIPGATYVESSGRYYSSSQGIHAKYLGDTVYLAIYAKLSDGSYAYSKLAPYSAVQYATSQLKNATDAKLKQLVVTMLNYGAEAQLYFGHNTGTLANAALTADQKNLPESYRSDMVQSVPAASTAKQGVFVNNSGFASRKPAISFEGAFCINYFFTPKYAPSSGITLYYWNAEDYNAASVLTAANATGKIKLEGSGTGEYRGDITGIAAKELSAAVYVACAYKDSTGTVWTSGVLGYSIGTYCGSLASKGGAIADLAQATAVYGYHAKQYFG